MEAIQSFASKVKASFDALATSVDGVADDVKFLKDKIVELQNSPGVLSAEDQASLDEIQARADTLSAKVKALDDATARPPTPTP